MNPCAGQADLPDFESGPFNHLGTTPHHNDKSALGVNQSVFYYTFLMMARQPDYLARATLFCIISGSVRYKNVYSKEAFSHDENRYVDQWR